MYGHGRGAQQALIDLGLIKQASGAGFPGPDGEMLPFWDSVKSNTYRQLFGRPGQYKDEVLSGAWKNPGSYVRNSLWPSLPTRPDAGIVAKGFSHLMPALYYLGPALGLYAASQAPAEHKKEMYGSALGSLAGSVVGAPLGILGASVGGLLGSELGAGAGRMFSHRKPETSYYDASAHATK